MAGKKKLGPDDHVRFGGKVYTEGDDDALSQAEQEQGVKADRAYGVDSTEDRAAARPRGPQARSAAIARRSEREQGKQSVNADELLNTPVDQLADAIAEVTDIGALKRVARRDKRVSAKPVYDARVEEIKAERDADEADEGEGE